MTRPSRLSLLFAAAVILTGSSVMGGRMGDLSLREPKVLITFLIMLGSFGAVLFLAETRDTE